MELIVFESVFSIIIVLGSLMYIFVLCVTRSDSGLRNNKASLFLYNLLTVDAVNLVFVMPSLILTITKEWYLSNTWLQVIAFMQTLSETASILALTIISVNRLVAVIKPFLYRVGVRKYKSVFLIAITWFQALLFSLIPIPLDWYCFNANYMSTTFTSDVTSVSLATYIVFYMTFNYLFPVFLITGCHAYILSIARARRTKIVIGIIPKLFTGMQNRKVLVKKSRRRELRAIVKFLIVIGAFIVCHLPYATLRLIEVSHSRSKSNNKTKKGIGPSVAMTCKLLSFSSSAVNPFIYFILQKPFQQSVIKRFVKLWGRSNRVTHDRNSIQRSHGNSQQQQQPQQTRVVVGQAENQDRVIQSPTIAVVPLPVT